MQSEIDIVSQFTGSKNITSHQLPARPQVGPTSTLPFKVIPDVENPEGIASTADGDLIVSVMQHKVIVFNKQHEKTLEIGGDPGLGMGQFLKPSGVAVDKDGNILVAGHYFVQKFSINGKFLQQAGGTDRKGFLIESPPVVYHELEVSMQLTISMPRDRNDPTIDFPNSRSTD